MGKAGSPAVGKCRAFLQHLRGLKTIGRIGMEPEVFCIHSVHMPPWDCLPAEEPFFSVLLKEFRNGKKKQKGRRKEIENGLQTVTAYRLRKKDFFWEKRAAGRLLQSSSREPYGWSVTVLDFSGRVTQKIRYDRDLRWIQTAYYKDGNTQSPEAFLLMREDGLEKLWKEPEGWRKVRLQLAPMPQGAGSSLAEELAGAPEAFIWGTEGLLCACSREKMRKRDALLQKLEEGKIGDEPSWEAEASGFSEAVLPEEEQKRNSAEEDFPALNNFSFSAEPFSEAGIEAVQADYAADHQLKDFQEQEGDGAEPPEAIQEADPAADPEPESGKETVTRYAVAARHLSGKISAPGILSRQEASQEPEKEEPGRQEAESSFPVSEPQARAETQPEPEWMEWFRQIPDKLITGRDGDVYAYYGELKETLRDGSGRTSMKNGHTAYEGGFRDDKKDGLGVYYYKSGRLCYAGNWNRNRRQGAGVSFSHQEGTMFAGKWRNNRPEGMGALFDEDGELLYVGQWKDGKRHGSGTEYSHGTVVFSGLWENGEPVISGRR